MNGDVLRYLRCPVCAGPLAHTGAHAGPPPGPQALHCGSGHSFDIARQGYVDLLAGRVAHPGDSAEMVAARSEFLAAGHYGFLSAALARAARGAYRSASTGRQAGLPGYPDLVVDAGAGTGHHLAAVLDALPGGPAGSAGNSSAGNMRGAPGDGRQGRSPVGLALDTAKPALRRAARAHPRAGAARCDTWRRLPLADGAACLVLDVFAPRNGAEFHRVLRADGTLLVVTPAAGHLAELVGPLGLLTVDRTKPDRVAASLSRWFIPAGEQRLDHCLLLDRHEVRTLVGMGPSARHLDPAALAERIGALPEPVAVTASVDLRRYHPRPDPPPPPSRPR